jgi:hypothetical protein
MMASLQICRRLIIGLAAAVTVVSFFIVLHDRFRDRVSPWQVVALAAAVLLICWLGNATAPARKDDGPGTHRRLGLLLHGVAWTSRGGLLAVAILHYGLVRPNDERLDGTLAAIAVAMIACAHLQRLGRAMAGGTVDWSHLRGRLLWHTLVRWAVYVVLAAAARYAGHLLAIVAFWVPVSMNGLFQDWWSAGWFITAATVVVSLLWAVVFCVVTGVFRIYTIVVRRQTHGSYNTYGSYNTSGWYSASGGYSAFSGYSHTDSTETHYDTVLAGPPPRTLLRPVLRLYQYLDETMSSSSYSSGGFSGHTTATSHFQRRVYLLTFPPVYLPSWLAALVRLLPRRKKTEPEEVEADLGHDAR